MRRVDVKREDGVAMTEFALIAPVFMLIVVGMLLFGRLFFYWIEANHLANETARWAVVDRNPYAPACPGGPWTGGAGCQSLQTGARFGGQTDEFENGTRVCIEFPEGAPLEVGDPVRVKVVNTFEIFDRFQIPVRGSSTMRIERFAGGGSAPTSYAEGSDPAGTCA